MANAWAKWVWSDWERDPALKLCGAAAQGLWMRMLCIAAKNDPIGFVCLGKKPFTDSELATVVGFPLETVQAGLAELESHDVFSRDRFERIYSRRMVRDHKKSTTAQENGKLGGNPSLLKQTENSSSDNPPSRARIAHARSDSDSDSDSSSLKDRGVGKGNANGATPHPKPGSEFDSFWRVYPHKVGKRAALAAFDRALGRDSLDAILAGLDRYKRDKPADRNWCNPATFLNEDRWTDQPAPPPLFQNKATGPPGPDDKWRQLLERKAQGR